jgi:glycosyltransferase involved in cell wall biosynthesis
MNTIRIMWLLHPTTLCSFERDMFHSTGIDEIFLPKTFSYDEEILPDAMPNTLDNGLSIPTDALSILNDQDWHQTPSQEAWKIANQYFDIIFIPASANHITSAVNFFKGQIALRVFYLKENASYTQLLEKILKPHLYYKLHSLKYRFWFCPAYPNMQDAEGEFLKSRYCFLPAVVQHTINSDSWQGTDSKMLLMCPFINVSSFYKNIYVEFKENFNDIPALIGGTQPISVNNKNVIGTLPPEVYNRYLHELRVMFYHSTEPGNSCNYPFDAIQHGMPLVFMAGGLLDHLGGRNLPGRCKNIQEARIKIKKILNNDKKLILSIQQSQSTLIATMKQEDCNGAWKAGLEKILHSNIHSTQALTKKRIAVIIPVEYRGGSLRGAKLLAEAIYLGSIQAAQEVEVVFGYLNRPDWYGNEDFIDLPHAIQRRPYSWKILDNSKSNAALDYALSDQELHSPFYQVPDDGINHFLDCDLLVFVSDRIEHPLLPLKPYITMVYDYLQRYENVISEHSTQSFFSATHHAKKVLVTTEFTRQDALQFAGLPESQVIKCPMLIPNFITPENTKPKNKENYFLWTTNTAVHKNHKNALNALRIYYNELDGKLKCCMTGSLTEQLFTYNAPHLTILSKILDSSSTLKDNLKILGELPEQAYRTQLENSMFLWHPARVDNGTFSVIEAACLGVPALSSDYPAMREIDSELQLKLTWMDPHDPLNMAEQLKTMELEASQKSKLLPTNKTFQNHSVEKIAIHYWNAVKECL